MTGLNPSAKPEPSFETLCRFENLFTAFRKAAKGKRHKPEVADFEVELEPQLFRLREELVSGEYTPGTYRSFVIREPKRRLISAAPFRDRVVHHALVQVIEPAIDRKFIFDSYANRRGKGTHRALDRAQAFARRYPFVLQCDLRQFFPSIDHQILRLQLGRWVDDERTCCVMDRILTGSAGVLDREYSMSFFPGDDLWAVLRPRGLPIGNLTSQFWANVYLDPLDQFVKRDLGFKGYLRYVDDFLLFGKTKRELWAAKDSIRAILDRLRLRMHEASSTVFPVHVGIPFLGFRVYPTHRRIKRRNFVAFARLLKAKRRHLTDGTLDLREYFESVRGWVAHASHGDTYSLRRSLLGGQPIKLRQPQVSANTEAENS